MTEMTLAEVIATALRAKGASLVSLADLRGLPEDVRDGLPFGISVAIALDPRITTEIAEGPTREYRELYQRVNSQLDAIGRLSVELLERNGFKAEFRASTDDYDRARLATRLPHKTVATRAGLGWIGKCALLVTREFGAAVRLTSVLTDASLPAAAPVETSQCGNCTACVTKCPAHAPSGKAWQAGIEREAFFDAFACDKKAREMMLARVGIEYPICGMCIAACPWTRKYLDAKRDQDLPV